MISHALFVLTMSIPVLLSLFIVWSVSRDDDEENWLGEGNRSGLGHGYLTFPALLKILTA